MLEVSDIKCYQPPLYILSNKLIHCKLVVWPQSNRAINSLLNIIKSL